MKKLSNTHLSTRFSPARRTRRLALLLASAAVLAACGGGGGGGSAASGGQNVPLTTANYTTPGTAAAGMVLDAGTAASTLDLLQAQGAGAVPTSMAVRPMLQWLLARPLPLAQASAAVPTEQPAASVSQACPHGGSISASANDFNNNGILDGNDSATVSFASCVLDVGAPAVSGAVSVQLNAIVGSGGNVLSGSISMNFNALGAGASSMTGGALLTVSDGGNRVDLQFNDMRVTQGGKNHRYSTLTRYDDSGASTLVTISGQAIFDGAAYTIVTSTPLTMGVTYPISGTLQVRDASGNRVDVMASPTLVTLDLYLSGDSVRDAQRTYAWTQIGSGGV